MISLSNGFMMYSLAPAASGTRDMIDVVLGGAEHHLGHIAAYHAAQIAEELVAVHVGHVSSRAGTASGMALLHASSALSPSSASTTWKSISSRMRRAIFSYDGRIVDHQNMFSFRNSPLLGRCGHGLSGECGLGRDFEHAIDIEDDHELSV